MFVLILSFPSFWFSFDLDKKRMSPLSFGLFNQILNFISFLIRGDLVLECLIPNLDLSSDLDQKTVSPLSLF